MYDFVFDGNAAKIILKSTGETVVSQPFKPVNAGSEPWTSEAEALAWMQENYSQFVDIAEPLETPLPPIEQNNEPPAEEPAAQGE